MFYKFSNLRSQIHIVIHYSIGFTSGLDSFHHDYRGVRVYIRINRLCLDITLMTTNVEEGHCINFWIKCGQTILFCNKNQPRSESREVLLEGYFVKFEGHCFNYFESADYVMPIESCNQIFLFFYLQVAAFQRIVFRNDLMQLAKYTFRCGNVVQRDMIVNGRQGLQG